MLPFAAIGCGGTKTTIRTVTAPEAASQGRILLYAKQARALARATVGDRAKGIEVAAVILEPGPGFSVEATIFNYCNRDTPGDVRVRLYRDGRVQTLDVAPPQLCRPR